MREIAILLLSLGLLSSIGVKAQDKNLFNHVGWGVSLGTDGIGLEAALPVGNYVQARTGFSFMPKFSYSSDVKYGTQSLGNMSDKKINIKGTLNMQDWKFLFDLYPSQSSTFHFTAGFYLGQKALVTAKNTESNSLLSNGGYILIGGQPFGADQLGIANVEVRTNSFKPYLGVGFGRAVPRKSKVGVSCDFGVQFWGKPKIYGWNEDLLNYGFREIRYQDIEAGSDAEDARDAIKTLNSIGVYPVISVRFNGIIF